MTELLIRLFIKDHKNTQNPQVRLKYGVLSGVVGIVLNIILSVFKIVFGILTKSVSVTADGANNFFDAGSSIINLVGFRIAGKAADKDHPFGHGRVEYISALSLAFLILLMGFELIKTSVGKLSGGEAVIFSVPAVVVLVLSIFAKIWLAVFNSAIGKKIDSVAIKAVAKDSIGDIAATTASLIALVASRYTDLPVDAVMGILVALLICYAGYGVIKDTMGPLLGEPPKPEIIEELEALVMSYDGVVGIHDAVLHSYGHSRIIGSLHAEVPANVDILISHDTIDLIERDVKAKTGIELTIHLDPIVVDDEFTNEHKSIVQKIVSDIDSVLTMHDFRVVKGPTHTNFIFDVVTPCEYKIKPEKLTEMITSELQKIDPTYFTVITVETSYI